MSISEFIARARHRLFWNEMLAQFALAAALLMAGTILLLVLGTQILDWRWLIPMVAGGSGFGIWRLFRRVPSPYRVAVLVDRRAGLHDSLSTALHFSAAREPAQSSRLRDPQREQAERLIPGIDLEQAIPFTMPRAAYAMAVLALAASTLFALRYGIRRQLDFRAPLTQIVMDGLGMNGSPEEKRAASQKKSGIRGNRADSPDDPGNELFQKGQKKSGELDAATAEALSQVGDPNVDNERAGSAAAKMADGKSEGAEKGEGKEAAAGPEQAENGQAAASKNSQDNPAGSREGPQQGEQSAGQQNGQSGSSLMAKMKEAMSNLLSKAKPLSNNAANGQKPSQGQQKAQSQGGKPGEKGSPSRGQDGQQQADAQGGQQGADEDSSTESQGKGGGKSADQQASSQPGSGVGKQDGSKDVKAAEQLAAMGKLSEVIGKRSQNVTGEMTIETQSGPQQLKTQYSQKAAAHGEAGGDVNRDEVPVALQGYVQAYFDEVRKSEKKSGGKAGGPEPKL